MTEAKKQPPRVDKAAKNKYLETVEKVRAFRPGTRVSWARVQIFPAAPGKPRWMRFSYEDAIVSGYYFSAYMLRVEGWTEWLKRREYDTSPERKANG